jgi:hypothetical protein
MSKITDAIAWFKKQFGSDVASKTSGTPFSLDMITAIACQETYYIWGNIYKTVPVADVLKVCVGDTLDSPNRSAFPKNKAALVAVPNGSAMFTIARDALESVGQFNASYAEVAHMNPNKFCHGFGIVQYDIQFFKDDPAFFLNKRWFDFGNCMDKCVAELKAATRRTYGPSKTSLSHDEMVYVAIAYNKGSADLHKNFKQGYKDSSGKFYGEHIDEYLRLAEATPPAA